MSKIKCMCGELVHDITDNLPNKARFIRDQDMEHSWEYADTLASLMSAVANGKRKEWIRQYFGASYPADTISDSHLVFDIVNSVQRKVESELFQCIHCGGILVQRGKENCFVYFKPVSDGTEGLFNGLDITSS